MHGVSEPVVINGVAVVSTPEDIDAVAAAALRSVLLDIDQRGHATVAVDMTGTLAGDPSVVEILVQADQRALAAGGALRLGRVS